MVSPLRSKKSFFLTIAYHDIFDYPLSSQELKRWQTKSIPNLSLKVDREGNYYYLRGRKFLIKKRQHREKISLKKMRIAKRGAAVLEKIPTVLFVGITGSLAMNNSDRSSDIDFLIITKRATLWISRLLAIGTLLFAGLKIRRAGEKDEKDKLCLNMWLDEADLFFDRQNIFTAHEIAQIVPLVNKNKTYERLIGENKWIFAYWPNVIKEVKSDDTKEMDNKSMFQIGEPIARWLQIKYMQSKISREVVSPHRAFFHPFDWGEKVMQELERRIGE